MPTTHRAHARVGLLGNPSDGYHGRCISLALANFWAEVTLTPQAALQFLPHPVCDGGLYLSPEDLLGRLPGEGYGGGVRLLKAACKVFYEHCREQRLPLGGAGNFRLEYSTSIPRQAGLSGSSALVTAALACLLEHHGLEERVGPEARPGLALAAEAALGIAAGLQDRVAQVYQGAVYMDFDAAYMAEHGRGRYEALPVACLPPLWLLWCANPSESGAVHSTVRARYLAEGEGGPIHRSMARLASLADAGRQALLQGDHRQLAEALDANFDTRREVFGDAALGPVNLRMVAVARSVGAAAKFTGSGGAVVAFCPEGEPQAERLRAACREAHLCCEAVRVAGPRFECPPA